MDGKRVLEMANEWGNEVVILQLDIEQAFGRLRHSAILRALYAKGASKSLMNATYKSLSGLRCRVRLGSTQSGWVQQYHGVQRGAPEYPAIVC